MTLSIMMIIQSVVVPTDAERVIPASSRGLPYISQRDYCRPADSSSWHGLSWLPPLWGRQCLGAWLQQTLVARPGWRTHRDVLEGQRAQTGFHERLQRRLPAVKSSVGRRCLAGAKPLEGHWGADRSD